MSEKVAYLQHVVCRKAQRYFVTNPVVSSVAMARSRWRELTQPVVTMGTSVECGESPAAQQRRRRISEGGTLTCLVRKRTVDLVSHDRRPPKGSSDRDNAAESRQGWEKSNPGLHLELTMLMRFLYRR
jgi:hypothetical protein